MKTKIIFLLMMLILNSCTTIKAKKAYDDALEQYEEENYEDAIVHLKKTIELCPESAKYYYSITLVYFEKGDLVKSWEYCRKTLQCPEPPDEAFFTFEQIFGLMCSNFKIIEGMPEEKLIERLGQPDKVIVSDNPEEKAMIYGISLFYIKQGYVTEAFFRGNPNPWEPIRLETLSYPKKKPIRPITRDL